MKFNNVPRPSSPLDFTSKSLKSSFFKPHLRSSLKVLFIVFLFTFSVYLFVGWTSSPDFRRQPNYEDRIKVNHHRGNRSQNRSFIDSSLDRRNSPKSIHFIDDRNAKLSIDKVDTLFEIARLNANLDLTDTNAIRRQIRSITRTNKFRKRRASPKRKVKRFIFRIDNWPLLKQFSSTRKLYRKRFVRRNVRTSLNSRLFNRPRHKVRYCFSD